MVLDTGQATKSSCDSVSSIQHVIPSALSACHGIKTRLWKLVYHAAVILKVLHTASVRWGFTTAVDCQRIDAFICRGIRAENVSRLWSCRGRWRCAVRYRVNNHHVITLLTIFLPDRKTSSRLSPTQKTEHLALLADSNSVTRCEIGPAFSGAAFSTAAFLVLHFQSTTINVVCIYN